MTHGILSSGRNTKDCCFCEEAQSFILHLKKKSKTKGLNIKFYYL